METYLLLDRRLLNPQAMENVQLEPSAPLKDGSNNPLMVQDKDWEIRIDNGYPNVLYDEREHVFHCFYTLFTDDLDTEGTEIKERTERNYRPRMDRVTSLAYARSRDGIHWEKPALNRVEWRGSKENNLLFLYAHGTGVMIDCHDNREDRRFKMVTKVDIPGKGTHMAVSFSPDAVHWGELIPWPDHNPTADSHNLPYWNEAEGCYMLLSRLWKDGIRITTVCRSKDFIHWSEPRETLRGQGFDSQIYSMPVFPWNHIYLGFASLIHEGDRRAENFDCVDCELTWSADGEKFDFVTPGKPLIQRGDGKYPYGEFDNSCIYASPLVKDGDGKLWIYYMGGNGQHTNFRETALGRAQWKPDRFAAYVPARKEEESVITTCAVDIHKGYVEILGEPLKECGKVMLAASLHPVWTEEPYEGFSEQDCVTEECTQDGWYRLRWKKDTVPGEKGCIRIHFQNLKVWAVRGEIQMAGHRLWEGADLENEKN